MVQMMAAVLIAYGAVPTTCITKDEVAPLHSASVIQLGVLYGNCTPPKKKKPWWEV